MRRTDQGSTTTVGVSVVAVAAGVAGIVALTVAMGHHTASPQRCSAPALAGRTVQVRLTDMAMMGSGGMGGSGTMHLTAGPVTVGHGTVSLAVGNRGHLTHEVVVLPLGTGQGVGARVVTRVGAPDELGRVDETGSVGEVSATCAAGSGAGIRAGATGWVTLRLPAGRYELLCNLRNHYAAGMYTELDVT